MRRLMMLYLLVYTPLLVVVALLIAGIGLLSQQGSSNVLLFMTGVDQFTARDWGHRSQVTFQLETKLPLRAIADFRWMPDGHSFVYNRDLDGHYESSLYDIFTRQTVPLGIDTPDNHLPVWTPVTQRWAWIAGSDLLCTKSADGDTPPCTNFENIRFLTWSPDGQSLAFFEESESRLLVLDVSASEAVTLDTGTAPLNTVPLTWSADSRSLAYLETGRSSPSISSGPISNTLVELHQVDGSWQPAVRTPIRLQYPTDVAYTIDHFWSPDGLQFAFSAVQSIREQNLNELYVFYREQGTMQRLTMNVSQEIHPRWSTDGAWLAYLENASGFPFLVVRSASSNYRDSTAFPVYGFNLDWRP
jgi:Tol biopolymer transport system component